MIADEAAPERQRFHLDRRLAVAFVVLVGVMVALAIAGGSGPLTSPKAILLGAVEGITEFLPVSSTGHLLVTQRLIGLGHGSGKTAADVFAISIQVGAILAVVSLYRRQIAQIANGLVGRDADGRRLLILLAVAFAPAAVIGVALDHTIKDHLFGPWPVIAAWTAGGVFLLLWRPGRRPGTQLGQLDTAHGTGPDAKRRFGLFDIPVRGALIIGVAQALALWPGVSRSLVTMVAAIAIGCEIGAAVEFSFLLGLATLTAATALDLAKDGDTLLHDYGWRTPLLGALVAFVTAIVAVRWLVSYLRTRPLARFGWYRLAIAAVTVVLVATGAV